MVLTQTTLVTDGWSWVDPRRKNMQTRPCGCLRVGGSGAVATCATHYVPGTVAPPPR
jgi:hypothetical protein